MSKIYDGETPCIGCGQTGRQSSRRSKNSLCFECERNLRLGKMCAEFYKMDKYTGAIPEIVSCEIPYNAMPIIYTEFRDFLASITGFSPDFAGGDDKRPYADIAGIGRAYSYEKFTLPRKSLDAARKLWKALYEYTRKISDEKYHLHSEMRKKLEDEREKIYNEGVERGRNLLFQLNSGQIGIEDFNKKQVYNNK